MDRSPKPTLRQLGRRSEEGSEAFQLLALEGAPAGRLERLDSPEIRPQRPEARPREPVHYSEFFRGALTFAYLEELLLPRLAARARRESRELRIWSAGCARGEEPYSIAVLLADLARPGDPPAQIFASDLDPACIAEAERGWYPAAALDRVRHGQLAHHFRAQDGGYRVRGGLRRMVAFGCYDVTSRETAAPPDSIFGGFDLVLCRHLLLYLDGPARRRLVVKLVGCLGAGGLLVLGGDEEPEGLARSQGLRRQSRLLPVWAKPARPRSRTQAGGKASGREEISHARAL
jgi:chemotaxis methyl-accepting protein methylase